MVLIIGLMSLTSAVMEPSITTFKEDQLRFGRVRTAYAEKAAIVQSLFEEAGISFSKYSLFICGFKKEKELQIWAKNDGTSKYKLIKTYDFCMLSGVLGPKRKQGDYQVPEGFYHIDRFNPASNFYLSLGINYPNNSDRKLSSASNLGGDIFVHGDCVTIGCVPITTPLIKELYIMCVEAKSNGQLKIPLHIYPAKLTAVNWNTLKSKYKDDSKLLSFWENLKTGYDHFEANKTLAKISISPSGAYIFN